MDSVAAIKKQVSELIILAEDLLKDTNINVLEISKLQTKLMRKNNSLTRITQQINNSDNSDESECINDIALCISKAEDVLDDLQITSDHITKSKEEEKERQERLEREEKERQERLDERQVKKELELAKLEQETKKFEIQSELEIKKLEIEAETKRQHEKLSKELECERLHTEKINNQNNAISAKLPKLNLPKFDGTLLRWQEFWDSFGTAIHENSSLKPVDKLNYLKCSLEGRAKNCLEGLQITNENYTVAIQILQERFGDQQRVIKAHYASLNDLPSCDPKNLQIIYDQIEKSLRSLEALGENVENNLLVCLIKSKLSEEIMFKLEEHKTSEEIWTVSLLRKKLKWFISAQTSAKEDCCQGTKTKYMFKANRHISPPISTSEALFVSNKNTKTRQEISAPNCIYCHGDHWNDQCNEYKTVHARKSKIKGCCFICFRKDHQMKDCRSKKKCFFCKKEKVHHSSLCPSKFPVGNKEPQRELAHVVQENEISENYPQQNYLQEGSLLAYGERVLMQTAKTVVQNPKDSSGNLELRLLLDCGSHRTYISSSLASKLKLKLGKKEKLAILTFGSSNPKLIDTQITSIKIQLRDGSFLSIKAHVVPDVAGTMERIPLDTSKFHEQIKDLDLADDIQQKTESTKIELLIGNDYYGDLLLPQKIFLAPGLHLLNSKLGWIISGRVKDTFELTTESEAGLLCIDSRNSPFKDDMMLASDDLSLSGSTTLSEFWQLETLGIKDPLEQNDDDKAHNNFAETVEYEDGRYYVTWPWKDENPDLPENYNLSVGRLKSTLKRLQVDENLLKKYDDIIQDQVKKGVIEKVTDQTEEGTRNHYIPHHPVVTPHKTTTKLRIVYDASAKQKKSNMSLNECLYRGPIQLQNLCGLLMRFQLEPIAILADIEKAFLQVGIQTKDRDVTRFMWLKDPSRCEMEENIEIYRFCRIPFGIISSPSLLMSTIQFHLNKFKTPIAEKLKKNIYVDNVIFGAQTTEEARNVYEESKKLFNLASMNLREWTSNSKDFTDGLPKEDKATGNTVKVLGLKWNLESDSLAIPRPDEQTLMSVKTKRHILKMIATIYDPLGYFSPVTLEAKLFLQSLYTADVGWDEQLSEENLSKWRRIAKGLLDISNIQRRRFIGFEDPKSSTYQLVCFADASAAAFAAVIYLRISTADSVKTTLIFSKCRLAPTKKTKLTIPRLELMAVLIGCRALKLVEEHLHVPLKRHILFTDSQCVLHWIHSEKTLSVFVTNRTKEIKEIDATFRYVNTKENPADLATRGMPAVELQNCFLWQRGPTWLDMEMETWPKSSTSRDTETQKQISAEERKNVLYETSLLAEEESLGTYASPIDETLYSSFPKLLRITAWVLRFVHNARAKKNSRISGMLTSKEIQSSENYWLLQKQRQHFPQVLNALHNDLNTNKINLISQLGLRLDDRGLIRCHGRLENAAISTDAIYPILLPRKDYFTELLIISYHKKLLHAGVSQTLAIIRNKYWIPKGRSEVRRVTNSCQVCKKWEGGSFKMQGMPPLPKFRVSPSSPFTYVGVDYFGPLYIKGNKKVWVCLYTCLAIRAIHLELLPDLSAEQFLLGLRRLVARYGTPAFIISDNAKQFKLSKTIIDKTWEKITKDDDMLSYAANEGIEWKFIVNLAPWMGGCYERMIGLVKRSLRKSLGKTCFNWDQLSTIICEVQAVVNTRPMIYVGDDINSKDVITPSHFLTMNPKIGSATLQSNDQLVDPDVFTNCSTKIAILQTWRKGQNRVKEFWNLWRNEYLLGLRERYQTEIKKDKKQITAMPKIGDVVIVKEKNLPRGTWRMAKIINLYKGRDGKIRSAQLLLPTRKTLQRPLSLLFPVEVS